jgi:molecular chaperone GrpE
MTEQHNETPVDQGSEVNDFSSFDSDEKVTTTETASVDSDNASVNERDLEAELKQADDKYLRLYAEFDNYRKRTINERVELYRTANQDVLVALLPVLDDFERSMKAIENASNLESVKEGVNLVSHKLKSILISKGLKPMEAKGEVFNADLHEAIANIPAPSDDLKGKVVDEVERGYYLGEKVIRYAKVVVGE